MNPSKPASKRQIRNRGAAKLSTELEKRIFAYAAAAGAAGVGLALSQPAEAKVIYTPTHIEIHAQGHYFVDLNRDGVKDFEFASTSCTCALPDTPWDETLSVRGAQKANGVRTEGGYAAALLAGVPVRVEPRRPFANKGLMNREDGSGYFNTTVGAWANVTNRYLGLKFYITGELHYGWARLTKKQFSSAILTGYAYETVPNKPIITGRTKSESGETDATPASTMPESNGSTASAGSPISATRPATLGMLAGGAQMAFTPPQER